jgi:hypothetical protein
MEFQRRGFLKGMGAVSGVAATGGSFDAIAQAAKAAQPAKGAAGSPYKDLRVDFGAVGNAKRCTDGSIDSGSTTLRVPSASFASGNAEVGKSIGVVGAGPRGTNLITTIARRTNSTTVELNAAASTTVSVQHVVYGADDTAAFQAAFDYAANGNVGVVCRVPYGEYFIAGALQDTSSANAQVKFPAKDWAYSSKQFWIVLIGDIPSCYTIWQTAQILNSGTVIHSLANGTTTGWSGPAIFGGGAVNSGAIPSSSIGFRCENMIFHTYQNPSIGAINGTNIAMLWVDGVSVLNGESDLMSIAQPTHANVVGIAWPQTDSPVIQFAGAVCVTGYYTGFRWCEFFYGHKVLAYSCTVGADLPATYHASQCGHLLTCFCKYGIFGSGVSTLSQSFTPPDHKHHTIITLHDVEHAAGSAAWYGNGGTRLDGASDGNGYDLYDPNNLIQGIVNYHTIQTSRGPDDNYRIRGGTRLTKTSI